MADKDEITEGLDQLRDSIRPKAQVAPQVVQQEIRRVARAYFRGAVVASVIASLLVGIPLVLLTNRFSQHASDDDQRFAQLQTSVADIQKFMQGVQGSQGIRGEPPVGWTVAEADGSITTCKRAEGFDPTAPRYRCSRAAPPSPTTTPPPPPSNGGLPPPPGE